MKKIILVLSCLFISQTVMARSWKTVTIPGAKCGNGSNYKVFVDTKKIKKNKLAVEFMGGGACWSKATCQGFDMKAWVRQIPNFRYFSALSSSNNKVSPLTNHAHVYFPYCTADIFLGAHKANYNRQKPIYHWGRKNVKLAFDYLIKKKIISAQQFDELVIYGTSAGALASVVNARDISNYFTGIKKRFLYLDSPGLHWGPDFWQKFTPRHITDFHKAFSDVGIELNTEVGNIAYQLPQLCKMLRDWKIAFMQSTKDYVMSDVFGEITPLQHRDNVLASDGLANILQDSKNCKVWINDTHMHSFLLLPLTLQLRDMYTGQSASKFVFDFYKN